MIDITPLSHPDIPDKFLGVRLDYDYGTPSTAILEAVVDDNAHIAAAAANTRATMIIIEEAME